MLNEENRPITTFVTHRGVYTVDVSDLCLARVQAQKSIKK